MIRFFALVSALMIMTSTSCEKELISPTCAVEGRWQVLPSTLYEFSDGLRYTIYSTSDNDFGGIEEAIPNPKEYTIEGDSITIDLDFGNVTTSSIEFKCDCNVLDLVTDQGTSRLYKEGYDPDQCTE